VPSGAVGVLARYPSQGILGVPRGLWSPWCLSCPCDIGHGVLGVVTVLGVPGVVGVVYMYVSLIP
jgi:hypothetical protein